MRRALAIVVLAGWAAMAASTAPAQDLGAGAGILVVDQEALFGQTDFGQEVADIAEAATAALQAENRAIEEDLVAEERALTERREDLSAEEFRDLADAFDQKVQDIRAAQDAKSQAIPARIEEDRRRFFQAIVPVLADILRSEGAIAMLDKRTVLLSQNSIDITDRAIEAVNSALAAAGVAPSAPGD